MIINNYTNYKHFVSSENSRTINNKTPANFQNTLSDTMSKKELSSNDNFLSLCSDYNKLPSAQKCVISKEKNEEVDQNDEITENDEVKDFFTICYECKNKEECEHYQKMIEGNNDSVENAIFLSKKANISFHINKVLLQDQLYELTGNSIIYNYNTICPEINIKPKKIKDNIFI